MEPPSSSSTRYDFRVLGSLGLMMCVVLGWLVEAVDSLPSILCEVVVLPDSKPCESKERSSTM
eukprot:scaffold248760_cov13-Prasinocladus_malaysianus.AAC.1